jgi:hypothetical protein
MTEAHSQKAPTPNKTGEIYTKLNIFCCEETHLQCTVEWVESFRLKLQNIQYQGIDSSTVAINL